MRTVALYGTSLVLRSLGALLQHPAGLQVIEVDPASAQGPLPTDTDVLVFDLETAVPASILALWRSSSTLTLIGIDLRGHEAFVAAGARTQLRTPADLVKVIEEGARRTATGEVNL